MEPKTALLTTYQFKGHTLQPFSKGRLSLAIAAGIRVSGTPTPSVKDVLGLIFLCLTDYKVRGLAQTDPALFWEKEGEWEDTLGVTANDFAEAAEVATNLLRDATETKAEPLGDGDLSQLPDPLPNEQSQTI